MKKFKRILSLVVGATFILGLTACGGAKTETTTTTKAKEESKATPKSGTEKDIEFWSVFTGGDGDFMQKMVDAYNATNPKIKVVHRAIAADDLYQKIPLAVQSGTDIPDLAINHVDRLLMNKENDVYQPMDEYIAANGKIKGGDYLSTAWTPGEIEGKRYAVPLDVHGFGTYYNKDLVAKYLPTALDDGVITFDEVAEIGPKAKADGVYTYAVTWTRPQFLGWYAQLGGKLSDNGTDPSFNNDKALKVLEDFKGAVDKGWATQDGDDPLQLFGTGKLVFLSEGTWMMGRLNEIEGLNYGESYSISYDAANPMTWTSSHQFVMPKNPNMTPERAAAIMDFVSYVGENSLEWANSGQVPASLKILEDETFKAMPQAFYLNKPEFLDISDYKYYGYAVTAVDAFATEVAFSRKDAKEALDEAVQQVADAIKNQ